MPKYLRHPDFPWYAVGDDVSVWRTHSKIKKLPMGTERWRRIKLFIHPESYRLYCCLRSNKRKRPLNVQVAKLVADVFVPNPDGLPYVGFRDNDPYNCKPENLTWSRFIQKYLAPKSRPFLIRRKPNHSECAFRGAVTKRNRIEQRRKYWAVEKEVRRAKAKAKKESQNAKQA